MIKRIELKSYLTVATAAVSMIACNSSKATMTDTKTDNPVVTVVKQPQQRPSRVPATPYPIKHVQPSGDTLTIRLYGDERHHWAETIDGYLILQKNNGPYEYAYRNENGIQISLGIIATDAEKRDAATIKAIEKAKVR